MPQPTRYKPDFSFTDFSAQYPNVPQPGYRIDAELDRVAGSIASACDNLALLQRDDGGLNNGVVGLDALSAPVLLAIASNTAAGTAVRGSWVTASAYSLGQFVSHEGLFYVVNVSHTAGVFADDLAAGKLVKVSSGDSSIALPIAMSEVSGLSAELGGKAPSLHSHAVESITGLQAALDTKASVAALDTKQPLDSDLTAIAALTTTSFGRNLLTLASTTAMAQLIEPALEAEGFAKNIVSGFIDPGPSNGSNDEAALLTAAAAAANRAGIVNGLGRKYRINGDFLVNGYSDVEFWNCHFIQAAASSGTYNMFHVTNGNRWKFRGCTFEVGQSHMGGWGSMDSAAGLHLQGGAGHLVEDCEFFGYGKLTALNLTYVRDSIITKSLIRDLTYDDSAAANDTIEGIGVNFCYNVKVLENTLDNFGGNGTNPGTRMVDGDFIAIQHTRGISVSGSNHCRFADNDISFVGQGIDVSGDEGNWYHTLHSNSFKMVALFGEKFANSASMCKSDGAFIDRVGYAGVVCSGVGSAMAAAKSAAHTAANPDLIAAIESTRNITINNLVVRRPGYGVIRGDGTSHFGQRAGALILQGGNTDLSPHGIRVNNLFVLGGGTVSGLEECNIGAASDLIANNGNPNNEFNTQVENVGVKSANFNNDFTG